MPPKGAGKLGTVASGGKGHNMAERIYESVVVKGQTSGRVVRICVVCFGVKPSRAPEELRAKYEADGSLDYRCKWCLRRVRVS